MAGPIRMSVVADTKDAVRGMGQAGEAATTMGRDFDRAGEKAQQAGRDLNGVGDGADTVASKGSQAAGALTGLGDLVGGKFGTAMATGGIAMQAAADAGDLLNVAVEGGAKLASQAATGLGKLTSALKLDKAAKVVSTGAQWALNAAMSANPIGLVVIAIAALTAGFVLAYKKSETFRDIVNGAFRSVKRVLEPIGEFIGNVISGHIDRVRKVAGKLGDFLTDGIPKAFEAVKSAARTAFNFVADIWNGTVAKIDFQVPDWIPGVGGKGFSIPEIPKFAGGGTVYGPTLALLGDNASGVEYAIPKEVMDRLGGGVQVNLNGTFIGATQTDVGRWVSQALDAYTSAGGRRYAV